MALGIGIIGLMGYGSTYFKTIEGIKEAEVVAVCDARSDVLQRVGDKYCIENRHLDYRDMLIDPSVQAVFIATPHFLHYRMTLDALKAGKHVFCEKPLAINGQEAIEMARVARESGLTLSCHYNRRQSVAVKKIKKAMEQNLLGEVYALNCKWMARYTAFMFSPDSAWRIEKKKAGGGILIGRGSHMIDAALYVLGMPRVISVNANVSNRLCGFEVDDYAMVMLRLENGSTIHIECSYENHIPNYCEKIEYQAFGTKAGLWACEQDGVADFSMGSCAFPENKWMDVSNQLDGIDWESAYPVSIIADFVDAVVNTRKPLISGDDGAYITQILDAAFRSSIEGCEIKLD